MVKRKSTKRISKKHYSTGGGLLTFIIIPIIVFILGYLITSSVWYGLAMVFIYSILWIFALIGFIPVIGLMIYLVISYFIIIPMALNLMSIEHTWLVTAILWWNALFGIKAIITYISLKVWQRKKK